ncbi:MAG TPA: G8 domain-containing protein, partial [Petrimonas sp.]|nr:G8 domain-containing protein [Petrimonas sp.]
MTYRTVLRSIMLVVGILLSYNLTGSKSRGESILFVPSPNIFNVNDNSRFELYFSSPWLYHTNPESSKLLDSYTAITSGDWNTPSTWGGVVPTVNDDVTIPTGVTITVNTPSFCNNIVINGTLSITGNNRLQVNGNWENYGTFTPGTNGTIEFAGSSNISINGNTNFEELIINKGNLNNTITINGTSTITSGGSLAFNSGRIIIPPAGSFSINPSNGITIPALAGIEVTGGTLNTGHFTITNEGLIRISSGTAIFGTNSGNSVHTQGKGAFIVNGGSVNIAGRLESSAAGILNPPNVPSGISISDGTVTLCTVGNGLNNTGSLNITSNGDFSFTGGTIIF